MDFNSSFVSYKNNTANLYNRLAIIMLAILAIIKKTDIYKNNI